MVIGKVVAGGAVVVVVLVVAVVVEVVAARAAASVVGVDLESFFLLLPPAIPAISKMRTIPSADQNHQRFASGFLDGCAAGGCGAPLGGGGGVTLLTRKPP